MLVGALLVVTAMAAMALTPMTTDSVPTADAQQTGLVNVQIGDVTIEDVTVGAAIALVLQACPALSVQDVAVAVASIVRQRGQQTTNVFCQVQGTGGPVTVTG